MSSFKVVTSRDGSRSFGDHDDRTVNRYDDSGGNNYGPRRNNKFKKGQGPPRYNNRGGGSYRGFRGARGGSSRYNKFGGPSPRTRLDDDGDISMGDEDAGPSVRHNPYGRPQSRQGSRPRSAGGRLAMDDEGDRIKRMGLPLNSSAGRNRNRGGSNKGTRGRGGSRPRFDGPAWYKITIPHGKKCDKDFLLKSITNLSSVPFVPIRFHYEQNTAVFYVQDEAASNAIKSVSRRVTMPNGFKMLIYVRSCPPPSLPMNEESVAKLKLCMSRRYDATTKTLDLKNLYHDEELKKDGLQLALNKVNVMNGMLKILQENIPELLSLDLSENRLYQLDSLSTLAEKAPQLCRLNLGKNQLKNESELTKIKDLGLEELYLDGNPLCDRFSDETAYISAIRKTFSKLARLDGHELPPPITFDVEAPTKLPSSAGSFFHSEQIQGLLVKFLEEYYRIYDSGNRQSLLDAYHDQAVFSMCFSYNKLIMSKQPNPGTSIQDSRNLLRVGDPTKRQRLIKHGKLNVVAMLNQLPATKHDPTSLVVDVTHAAPTLMAFAVQGIFKETDSKSDNPPVRAFTRSFITAPQGTGIVIVNEAFTITNATPEQVKNSFKNPAPTPSSSPVLEAASSLPMAPPPEVQKQMVQQFALQSGMNEDWSTKCLVQNEWDYEKSARVFTELQGKGVIPPDAFLK